MTESDIETRLGKQLRKLGCLYFKFVSPGSVGVPDRIIILPGGRIIFAELKAEDGKLSRSQVYTASILRRQGCDVRLVRGIQGAEELTASIMQQLAEDVGGMNGV